MRQALPIFATHFGPQDEHTLGVWRVLQELGGSGPQPGNLRMYLYNVQAPGQTRMQALASFTRPEEAKTIGLLPETILGEVVDPENRDPTRFRTNHAFMVFLHRVIGSAVPNCPWLRYQASKLGNGNLPIVDQRAFLREVASGPEDVIGECEVRDGYLVGYRWSPSYRVFTGNGFIQLDPWFECQLIDAFQELFRSGAKQTGTVA